MDLGVVVIGSAVVAALVAGAVHLVRRRQRHRSTHRELFDHGAAARIPATLHPVIDPDICIGSLSCLKACPEGDILGVVNGVARLVQADHCIGHGRCAAECPVGAISLVFGTAQRGVDLPMVDEFFESSRPGVHVVGELGGMGLIKNAITQGVQVASRLAEVTPRTPAAAGTVDVAIVGSGPAGLATALGLQKAGRTFRVLEQGTVGGTIAHYPRQKVVMTEPVELPLYGKFGRKLISKEELIESWQRALQKGRVRVEEGTRVEGIQGADGAFEVLTTKGAVRARKVVLATGRRGTPRKLGVPGEELPKVAYGLVDPDQYDGARVLVVGGGDSALEAAIQLAEQSDAEVAISYRSDSFSRARDANRRKIEKLIADGRVFPLLPSTVEKITPREVVLTHGGAPLVLPNDFVIAAIGGELPVEFLARSGVEMKRHFGEKRAAPVKAAKAKVPERRRLDHGRRIRALLMAGAGLVLLAWLAAHGWEYYVLSRAERTHSQLHAAFRPAGRFGHSVGIAATAFMLLNFLYPVRKRSRRLSRFGQIKSWLDFHMFVGFMSPAVIAFHAAFQSNNQLATATAGALLVVVTTGIVGRYIYGLVPSAGGKAVELSALTGQWERLKARILPLIEDSDAPALLHRIFDGAAKPLPKGSLVLFLLRFPFAHLLERVQLLRARRHFADRGEYREFRDGYDRLWRLRVQIGFFDALKRLLRGWRLFHAVLAVFLVVIMTAHIGVSLYLGYGWPR